MVKNFDFFARGSLIGEVNQRPHNQRLLSHSTQSKTRYTCQSVKRAHKSLTRHPSTMMKRAARNSPVVRLPWRGSRWPAVREALQTPMKTPEEFETALNVTSGTAFSGYSGGGSWLTRGGLRSNDPGNNSSGGSGFALQMMQRRQSQRIDAPPCVSDERFFNIVLPHVQASALALPGLIDKLGGDIAVLQPMVDAIVRLPREVVHGLLSHMFFCTFDEMGEFDTQGQVDDNGATAVPVDADENAIEPWRFNEFTARGLHTGLDGPMKCLIHYFDRCAPAEAGGAARIPPGDVIFHRQVLAVPSRRLQENVVFWERSTAPVIAVEPISEAIEIQTRAQAGVPASTHADFANEFIGGGVLSGGNVQEEILFVIKPECLVSLLIGPRMESLPMSEAIILTGCEQVTFGRVLVHFHAFLDCNSPLTLFYRCTQFSSYGGYGGTFTWTGDFDDSACPRVDENDGPWSRGTLNRHIYGIDGV
jgi:Poly (ADP-ribose) glycohydrolase (PARG), Macro domain fold/Poly (ADP-ribose) glycohydrolase (PARG), helical domain